jgi:hypothetical protein
MTTGTTAAPTEAEAAKPTYPAASTPAVCDNPILCGQKRDPEDSARASNPDLDIGTNSSYENPTVRDGCRLAKQNPCEQDPSCFTPPDGAGPGWFGS